MINNCVVSNIIFNNNNSNNEVRGHIFASSVVSFKSVSSFSSNKSEKLYLDQMQKERDKMVQNKHVTIFDSFQLRYTTPKRQNQNISKVADTLLNMRNEYVHNIVFTCINTTMENSNNIINIQLNYNVNWTLNQNSWDSEFRTISLHSSMKYLGSDIKNIKKLLFRMEKYILSKDIDGSKANKIKDFKDLSKIA